MVGPGESEGCGTSRWVQARGWTWQSKVTMLGSGGEEVCRVRYSGSRAREEGLGGGGVSVCWILGGGGGTYSVGCEGGVGVSFGV